MPRSAEPGDRLAPLRRSLSLRARYLTAITIIAVLALAQFLILSLSIYDQRSVAAVIDLAEQQRFLTQRVAQIATRLAATTDSADRAELRTQLLDAAERLELQQRELADGGAEVNPIGWPPPAVRVIFFTEPASLDGRVHDYVARVRILAATIDRATADRESLARIERDQEDVLGGFTRVIGAYLDSAADRERQILETEVLAFVATLLALGAILLAIFVPMERRIEAQQTDLVNENDRLTAVVVESQGLLAMVPVAELADRFIDGAARIVGAQVTWIDAPELRALGGRRAANLNSLSDAARALVRRAGDQERLVATPTADALAIALPLPPDGRRLICFAQRRPGFVPAELTALTLFANIFMLSARNAGLFVDLQDREARVAELDKFKSDLIAMLAHDFRGPLTAIIGYAELIHDGSIEADELASVADTIGSNAWRLANFATDTLTMSQLERNEIALDIAEVDLVGLSREAGAGWPMVAINASREPLPLRCDPKRLRQVLDNLIGNAVKYSGDDKPVTVTLDRDGDLVTIAIADRGIGIPAAEIEHVFSRFARGSNAKRAGIRGTGFGLYLSRMIVQLHGGEICVTSSEGAGSTFTIKLPAGLANVVQADLVPQLVDEAPLSRRNPIT